MLRQLIPAIMILVALLILGSLVYITIPQKLTSSYTSTTILTAVNLEIIADYSTSSASCTGTAPVCFGQVFPFTHTETYSGETTLTIQTPSTSTNHVPYATGGTGGAITVALVTILFFAGVVLLARNYLPNHPLRSHELPSTTDNRFQSFASSCIELPASLRSYPQ